MKISNQVLVILMGMSAFSAALAGELAVQNINQSISGQVVNGPAERAKQFLLDSAAELQLQDGLNDLKIESISETPVGFHVRFSQMQGGLPVDQSNIVVTLGRQNDVISYTSDYSAAGGSLKVAPRFDIPESSVLQIAYDYLKLSASPTRVSATKKVMVIDGTSRPVYQVSLAAPIDQKWSWELMIDANTGTVYRSESKAYDAVVTATVFDPNPTIKSGKAFGTVTGYSDTDGVDSPNTPFYDSMLTDVQMDLPMVNGKYSLVGKYAKVTDHESPKNADCSTTSSRVRMNRSDKCFTDMNAFYFINKSMAYLNETLKIKAMPIKYAGAFHVDPHGLNGADNSHYDGSMDQIAFGDGGVADGQDHDVVLHELGHAIHNWVTKGHLSQVEGLSEGVGDYWASSYSRTFMTKTHVAYNWTFSYDGHNQFWPGRVVNFPAKYPAGAQGEIHDAGQLWASSCMEIWEVIGKQKMDTIFWSGMAMLNERSTQADAAKAVLAAARKLYASEPTTIQAVLTKFKARGYPVQ